MSAVDHAQLWQVPTQCVAQHTRQEYTLLFSWYNRNAHHRPCNSTRMLSPSCKVSFLPDQLTSNPSVHLIPPQELLATARAVYTDIVEINLERLRWPALVPPELQCGH